MHEKRQLYDNLFAEVTKEGSVRLIIEETVGPALYGSEVTNLIEHLQRLERIAKKIAADSVCPTCDGFGYENDEDGVCSTCNGTGTPEERRRHEQLEVQA